MSTSPRGLPIPPEWEREPEREHIGPDINIEVRDLEARLTEAEREVVTLRADDPHDCPEGNCIQETGHKRAVQLTAAGRHYDAHVMESLAQYLEQTIEESNGYYRNWQAAEREVRVLREAIAVAKEQHPYPLDIFLANVTDYERIVPDPQTRTAISGVVGRIGYDACLARIDRHIAEAEESDPKN